VRAKPPPGFKNVDLEIVSRSRLDALETALGDSAHALFSGALRRGIYMLALECNHYPKDADSGIVLLCAAVERLGKSERSLWDKALSRTFDIGYGLGGESGLASIKRTEKSRSTLVVFEFEI
jgi:hypothetical protein